LIPFIFHPLSILCQQKGERRERDMKSIKERGGDRERTRYHRIGLVSSRLPLFFKEGVSPNSELLLQYSLFSLFSRPRALW
jgi:hypothetical protein